MTQAEIARAVGCDAKQVYRWERGESEPSGMALLIFISTVRGSFEEVAGLVVLSTATLENAVQDAERDLLFQPADPPSIKKRSQEDIEAIKALVETLTPDQAVSLKQILDSAIEFPHILWYLHGYIERHCQESDASE